MAKPPGGKSNERDALKEKLDLIQFYIQKNVINYDKNSC